MGRYEFCYPDPTKEALPFDSESVATAIGEAVIHFEELDDEISTAISFLLSRGDDVGRIVTAELSFRNKLSLLSSLFRLARPESPNVPELDDICSGCTQIEGFRNQVVHSKWRLEPGRAMTRTKYTARGNQGLRRKTETLTPDQVDAVAAHCGYLAHLLDQLMYLEFGAEYGQP